MNIFKHLIPQYQSYESVVFLKEGTKTEVDDCLPIDYVTEEDYEEFKTDTPDGVALCQYFCWLGLKFPCAGVIRSDLIPWDEYNKPLSDDEKGFLEAVAVKVVTEWNDKMFEMELDGKTVKVYLQDANVVVEQEDGTVNQMFVNVGHEGEDQ